MGDVNLSVGPAKTPEVNTEAEPEDIHFSESALAEEVEAPHVEESVVRVLVKSCGSALGGTIGRDDVEDHWHFDDEELDDIVPPLTRIINRKPKLRAAVARGDEAVVAMVLANYTGRNLAAGKGAKIAEEKRNAKLPTEAQRTSGGMATEGTRADQNESANGQSSGGVYPAPGGAMG